MEEFKERIRQFWNLPISLKAFYYLLFLTLGDSIFLYIRPIINAAGLSGFTDKVFILFWIIGIYFCLSLIFKSIRLIDIVAYLAICSFYYLSPTIYPSSRIFVENTYLTFALHTIPFYFLALMLDFKRDKTTLTIISKLQLVITAFFVLLSLLRLINSTAIGEQMVLAYSILFPTMFLYYTYSLNKNKLDLLFFLLGVMMILMFGNRGSLLCLLVYLIVFLFLNYKNNIVLSINLVLFLGVIYIFLKPIMLVLMYLTRMVGLTTRIFEKYLEDELFSYENSTGRDKIHELLWNNIVNDSGGIGYGLGSDRLMGRSGTEYAHNLVYEVWMDYGLYIGSFLLLIFVFFIVKTIKKAYGSDNFNLFLILFLWSVGHLMLSGSYLEDFQVYFFIGYCVNVLRNNSDDILEDNGEDTILIQISDNNK